MLENAIATAHLLVVSREPAILRPVWSIGESNSWHLETAGSGWEAMERIQSGAHPDLILLELPRGDADSLHILRWLRRLRPELPILLISHPEDANREKEAIRLGAREYLTRPLADEQLELVIKRLLASSPEGADADLASEDIEQLGEDDFFVGASPVMRKLREQAQLLAETNVPVLILGESGSGRDTAARLIHKLSVRCGFQFVKVNCAALPAELLEGELFGSERFGSGGTHRMRAGKFEVCEKGTILLEGIAAMPTELQLKLVQVLQSKQFVRQGGTTPIDLDVRIMAGDSVNLERAVAEKRMREDLYHRLSAFTLRVPPLRQRRDEIPVLLHHFMHRLARHYSLPARTFSVAVMEACQLYPWPGNLRELETFVKRHLMMGDQDLMPGGQEWSSGNGAQAVFERLAPVPVRSNGSDSGANGNGSLKSLVQSVKLEAEMNAISAALEKTGWNRKAAARLLKVSYRTLLYKIEQYHMRSPEAYPSQLVDPWNGLKGNGKVS